MYYSFPFHYFYNTVANYHFTLNFISLLLTSLYMLYVKIQHHHRKYYDYLNKE